MFRLGFAIVWTGLPASFALVAWSDPSSDALNRLGSVGMALIGLALIVVEARRYRRRRSLRFEAETGWYVWVELDGTERRSREDPTPDWDGAEGDGDGDGGD